MLFTVGFFFSFRIAGYQHALMPLRRRRRTEAPDPVVHMLLELVGRTETIHAHRSKEMTNAFSNGIRRRRQKRHERRKPRAAVCTAQYRRKDIDDRAQAIASMTPVLIIAPPGDQRPTVFQFVRVRRRPSHLVLYPS